MTRLIVFMLILAWGALQVGLSAFEVRCPGSAAWSGPSGPRASASPEAEGVCRCDCACCCACATSETSESGEAACPCCLDAPPAGPPAATENAAVHPRPLDDTLKVLRARGPSRLAGSIAVLIPTPEARVSLCDMFRGARSAADLRAMMCIWTT